MKLLILEKQPIVKLGLEFGLAAEGPTVRYQFASNLKEAIAQIEKHYVDIFLFSLSSKIDEVANYAVKLKSDNSYTKVAALVDLSYRKPLDRLILAKIDGIFTRNVSLMELTTGLQEIKRGKLYRQSSISHKLHSRTVALKNQLLLRESIESQLTTREKEVIRLMSQDLSTDEMAEEMCLSKRTIEGYRLRVFEKTGCKSALAVARLCLDLDWVNYSEPVK